MTRCLLVKSLLLQVCFFFFFFLFVFFFKQIGSTNHISESLGAVIDPDMSWSSSLNTPRTVTPTVLVCNSTSAAGDFMKGRKNKKNLQSFLTPVAYKGYCSSSEESYLKKVIPDDKLSNHTYKESSECLATAPSKIPSFTDSLHDTGFKTASNNTIKVYSASFDKAQSMFEETEDLYLKDQHLQKSSLCLKRCSEKEFSKSFSEADKMWCSSKLPSSNNVFLTPSQKAEVYELCSFLEEAGTQFELTQTEKTKSKSNNCNSLHSTGDQETIPSTPNVSDILNGINFDDSFNAENNTSLNTKPAMDLMMTIDSHEESCEKVCTSIQSAKTVNSLYLGKKGNDLSFSAQGKEPNGGSDVEKGVNTSTQDSVGAVTHLEGIDFHKRLLKEGEMNTETENERHIIKQQLMCPSPAENGDIASYTMVRESSNNTESREMKENNVIKGFYTASGKKLNISKNAMESATSIFEDLCPEKNWTCSYLSKSLNTSDTSESQPAKHFSVPRKVVNRSFKEVSQTNKNECKPSYFPGVTVCIQNETQLNPNLAFSSNKDHSENKDQSSSVGFMSANKSFKNSNNKFMSVQGLCGLESFQTASGNVITYGQESLAKGLTLFSEEDDFSPYGDKKCSDKCDFQFENEHNSADTGIHVSKGDFGNLMDVSSSCLVSHCHKRKTDSNLPKLNDDASKRAKEMFKDSGNLNDELLTDVCLIVADGVKHHCTKPRLNDSLSSEVGELGNVQCPVSKRNFDITQVNLLNTSNNGRDGPNVSLPIDMVIFSSENRKSLQHMNSKYGTCDMTLSCGLLCNKSLIQDDLPMQHDSFVSDNSDSDGNKVGVSCVGLGTEHNVSYQKPYMLGENYTYEDSTKRANNIVTDTTAHCENFQTTAFCKNGNQNLTSEQVLKKKGTFSNIDKTLAPSVSAVSTTSRFLLHSDSEKKVCFSKTVFCEEEALLRGPDEANRIKKDIRCDAENMKQSGMPHSKCARNVAGFSTANGKTIFFSEEAFCKAKALLNDCEDRNSQICATEVMKAPHLPLENCAKNVVGFSTTSRKNIFISEKSFSDAKSLLKNCENKKLEESKSFDMVNMKVPCPPVVNYKPESAAGFNTASGKRITITEKALEDTKALFNNCDEETNDRMISSGSESTESPGLLFKNCVPSSASGFTTASGKRVQFSEKAFSEATALLKDCVDTTSEKSASSDSESLHHLVNHYTKNIQRLNVARGKMLSEKASDDTKTLLNYSKDETNEKKSISDFENTKVPDLYPPSCNSRNFARVGPSTNKRTLFSEKALHHSKKSLKDGEDERKKNISKSGNGLIKSKLLFADCIKNNTGFTTVSGNKFVISESALHDSKALLNEYVNEVTEEHTNSDMVHQQAPILPHVNCITESAAGFTTASGKKVLITEKALHDAEVFFKDCDSERNEKMIGSGAEFSKVPGFSHVNSGFRTASGKNVLFSEKALCDAKVLLSSCENDINTIISTDAKNMKVPDLSILDYSNKNVTEFSIARENNVFSSKKAFCDAKTSFDNNCGKETYEKNATINDEQMKDFGPPLLGFSTASRKTVLFSEKAYEEAKEILREASDYVPALLKARTQSLHPEQMNNIVGINQEIKADSFDCNESYSRFCTPALQERANNEKNNSTDMTMTGTHFEHELKSVPSQPSMTNDKTLNLHVDSFGECTETQQRFIEQEALECTKALINDENEDENVENLLNQNRNPPENWKESFCTGRMRRPTIHAYYKYAASFRFKFTDYFSKDAVLTSHGAQLADGGWLISDDSGTAGKEEFYRALCDTPGVDPKLITENWVYNHYSLIIWKLAAMETAFPNVFGGCCLTPERVLLQLKYRYDVEIDRCQRSAIKKITERDDSPAKTLILCISKIIANGSQPYPNIKNNTCTTSADKKKQLPTGVIEVTDGWYLIKAHLDARLTALLQSGKLSVGNKIVTNGAELIGCQDACTPLEAPESLMLKISANSTRPARWYCKLGFYCDPRPFVLPLSSLFYDGGIVGCVDVIILRSYSLQWMEKRPNGVFLFRNERAEVREAKRQEDSHQKNMEELFARVQAEFEKDLELKNKSKGKSKVKLNIQQIQALQDGAELYEAFESSTDPGFLETCLSAQQVAVLNRHKQAVNDQKQAKLQEKFRKILESSQEENSCTKRDVTPVWKLHIVDYKDLDASKVYMLNVWRPTVDLCSLLKEGDRYKIYHLAASQPKGRMGSTSVQLTVTKKTQFQQLQVSPDHLTLLYKCREAVNFRSLSNPTFQPPCEEVDLVGLVICIEGKQGGAAVVYLCDEELNFVALKTWSSLNHLAADDIIMPMTLLAASNLHFKYNSSVAIPVVYGGDLATFSGNPKEKHLHSAIEHLKKNIQNIQDFCKEAEKKLNKLKANTAGFLQSRECYTHSKQNMDKTNQVSCMSDLTIPFVYFVYAVILKPFQKLKRSVTPAKRKAVEDEESDRKSIKKKKALDFLSRIPSPPPLTPLKNIVSDSLKKGFHPPRKQTFTPETRKEETSDKSQAVLCNKPVSSNHFPEDQWVNDEELAMINTQALLGCLQEDVKNSST
uniref:Tower domain-containing protein n=1 Tax=Erpetoichthys calabaricus TaxID=27687 RepID=A0A8C4RRQ8_ERPCA